MIIIIIIINNSSGTSSNTVYMARLGGVLLCWALPRRPRRCWLVYCITALYRTVVLFLHVNTKIEGADNVQ